jgi:hypothetical protein
VHPVTLRRSLVFGVCALGVAGLYLVPSIAGTPSRLTDARTEQEPRSALQPVGFRNEQPVDSAARGSTTSNPDVDVDVDTDANAQPSAAATTLLADGTDGTDGTADRTGRATAPAQTAGQHAYRQPGGAAARERGETPDRMAPSTVSDLSFLNVTAERVTIRWAPATDNVGVAGYRIWLNGFRVADTTSVEVAVPWFNDGSPEQVVQVRAFDAAGNQSSAAPARLVERPLPGPEPVTSDSSVPSAAPGSTRAPSADPSNGDTVE